jgi:hypothetical protein
MNPLLKEIQHNPLLWLLAFMPGVAHASIGTRCQTGMTLTQCVSPH